jgi:hypothetical protein
MNDLDSRARAIIENARQADEPLPTDRDRIKRAILVQLAAGTVVSTAAAAGTMTVGMKVGVAVLAVSLVGGGAAGVAHWVRPHNTASVAMVSSRRIAPAPRTTTSPVAVREIATPPVTDSSSTEGKGRRPERSRKVASPVSKEEPPVLAEDVLTAEVAVLKRAREELRMGRPAKALEALLEYDRRFGKGVLGEERQAIAAIASCQAQPGPRAQAQARAFMLSSPKSPLLERVRAACITPARADSP